MAQKHKDTKPFKSFWKNTKKEVCHYNVTISKLLPSVSRDKNHPQAADELTRYMLITGGKFIRTIRQYSLQNWQFKSFERQLCELQSGQDFYLPESMQ